MNLSIGIVGLPNVGKSTLFNALLKKTVAYAANYPFATIEPNVGVVEVPDERLTKLAEIVNTQKIIPAAVEFYDIAGLVKGASTGEGLGNKFLAHIREVAAIAHVVRIFEDTGVIHVANKVDPLSDIQTVETELILADMATLEKQQEPKGKASKEDIFRYEVVKKLKEQMNNGIPARKVALEEEEKLAIKDLQLLTMKPVIFVFNVSENQLADIENTKKQINELFESLRAQVKQSLSKEIATSSLTPRNDYIYLNAKLENEVLAFNEEDQKSYLQEYGLTQTGLNRLIQQAYSTLGLISFLTAGEKEVRAWTITQGTLAPKAAATIHTDFETHFIKADIASFNNFVNLGGWVKCREAGKVQIVGKDYEMKDGDIVEFKVGV
ncbi:MAG TPA: redox-regulated ATPase YchF [Candidatus Woesebacteria bacterium]|nr:redox-regulated ATPase YchF [Candidatus Woesebacteria bacterium]